MIKSFKCKETEKVWNEMFSKKLPHDIQKRALQKLRMLHVACVTQNALANAIFVPPNRIHQIIKGQRRITADTDLRLTTYFGLSQGYFLRYQEDYELRIARREIADDLNRIKPIQALG